MNALDKEEFRIKLEEINKLVQDKDYKGAMNIVDSIDWRRVKNVRTLCVVGEIYAANGRYEDSKEIFLLAYHKASIGKNILYRLIEISLRMDDINEAEEFFEEYKQVASNDSTQYILQYKIARAKNSSLNEQIRILEEYKEQEFTEKWSYELAALYYKAFCGVTAYKIFPVLGYSLLCNAPLRGSHDAGNIGVFFSDPLQPSSPCRHGSGGSSLYIGLTFFVLKG